MGLSVLSSRRIPFDLPDTPTWRSLPSGQGPICEKNRGNARAFFKQEVPGFKFTPRKLPSLFVPPFAKQAKEPERTSRAAAASPGSSSTTRVRNLIRRLKILQKSFDQLDWHPLKGTTPALKRLQAKAEQVLSVLDSVSEFSMGVLLGLYGLNRSYDPWLSAAAARKADDYVDKIFSDPKNLKSMARYLSPGYQYSGYQEEMFLKYRLLPAVRDLLLHTKSGEWIPSLPELLTLAKTHPLLEGPVVLAAAYRGEWLEGHAAYPVEYDSAKRAQWGVFFKRLSGHRDIKSRAMALEAARHFPGGADSFLPLFFKDPQPTLRLGAYQALGERKGSVQHFVEGIQDPSLEIRVYCVQHLVERGSNAVLPFLLQRTKEYVDHPGENSEISRPIVFVSSTGDRGEPLSLKDLALRAFAKFGGPSPELWQELLNKETDEANLRKVAQAIRSSVSPDSGIPLLLKRLQQGAPDGLFIETLQWIERVKWKQALPLAYQLIVLHHSPEVRRSALAAAGTIHYHQVLQQLLRDSRHPKVQVRVHSAEALAAFQEVRAFRRLTLMLKDPDPSVRQRAAKSLQHLKATR